MVTVKGTANANAGATVTIPTHAVGDLIILFAFRDGSTTQPSKPTASGTVPAWVDILSGNGANTCSERSAYFVATATNHTSGTWTNATGMVAIVVQGQKASSFIGGTAKVGGTSSTIARAPSITQSQVSGKALLIQFYGHRTVTAWSAAPAGYSRQASVATEVACNTKDSSTTDGQIDNGATTSGSSGYRGQQIEILADDTAPTVALNSPADTATGQSTTPALQSTATDAEADDARYEVQVDTVNTFDSSPITYGSELVTNGGFETDTSDPPSGWANFNTPANIARTSQNTEKHAGNNAFYIHTTDGATADCGLDQNEGSGHLMTVEPNTTYKLSAWMKTTLTVGQVHIHVKLFQAGYAGETGEDLLQLTGTNAWGLQEATFTTGAGQVIAEIWLCFGAYGTAANGEAWFDDVSLKKQIPAHPLLDKISGTDTGFSGSPDNTDPFASGQAVTFTVQAGDTLANSTTYYWRVRAKDPTGTNGYGAWSSIRSFTTSASGGGPTNLKTFLGLVKASIKTINGLAIASVKSVDGVT